jgi:crossover junction endodeoxyribonuclease RuvC
MNVLGIDPGQSGGLVLLGPSGNILDKKVMPVDGTGDLDKQTFADILVEWWLWNKFHVYLERIVPFALTAKSALTFGRQLGMIEQFLWEHSYPVTFVEAPKWTKEIHQGIDANLKPKIRSSIAVERLFPGVRLLGSDKSKKNHDGLVDALLIAEYGRRKINQLKVEEIK